MAVKCKKCAHKMEGNQPRLCPKCGSVMAPFVVKTEGKEKKEKYLEKLES